MTLTELGHKLDTSPSAISRWIAVSLKNIDMLIVDEVGTHDTEYMDAIERNISAVDVQLDKLVDLYLDSSLLRDKLDTRQRELTEQQAI